MLKLSNKFKTTYNNNNKYNWNLSYGTCKIENLQLILFSLRLMTLFTFEMGGTHPRRPNPSSTHEIKLGHWQIFGKQLKTAKHINDNVEMSCVKGVVVGVAGSSRRVEGMRCARCPGNPLVFHNQYEILGTDRPYCHSPDWITAHDKPTYRRTLLLSVWTLTPKIFFQKYLAQCVWREGAWSPMGGRSRPQKGAARCADVWLYVSNSVDDLNHPRLRPIVG